MATKLLSIDELMVGTAQAVQASKEASTAKQEIIKQQAESVNKQVALAEQAGIDLAAVARQQGIAALQVQENNIKAAQAAGISAEADRMVDMLSQLRVSQDRTAQKAAEVRRKTETPFWDSPVQWLVDNVTLESSVEELQASAQETQVLQTNLTGMNNALQETFNTNKGKAETLNAETIAAQARLAATDALSAAEKYRIQGQQFNIAGIEEAKSAPIEQMQLKYQLKSAQTQEEQLRMAREDQGMQRERFSWEKEQAGLRTELLKAEQKDKEQEVKLSKEFITTVNLGRASRGMPTLSELEAATLVKSFKSGQLGKEMQVDFNLGMASRANGGKQVLGQSPSEALEIIYGVGAKIPEAQQKTADILNEAASLVSQNARIDPKNKEAVTRALDKQVKDIVTQEFSVIRPGSAFDIGDLGDPGSGYLSAPAVANLPVVTKILKPLADNKQPLKDPQAVLELVRASMRKGELTSSQAGALSLVYQKANDMNQAQRNFGGYGIALPNRGAQYIVKIGSEKIDLTQPEQVQRFLMKPPASQFRRTDNPFLN